MFGISEGSVLEKQAWCWRFGIRLTTYEVLWFLCRGKEHCEIGL